MSEISVSIQKAIAKGFAQQIAIQTRTNGIMSWPIQTAVARPAATAELGMSGHSYIFRWLMIEASDIPYNLRLDSSAGSVIAIPAARIVIIRDHDFKEVYIDHLGGGAAGFTFAVTVGYNTKFVTGSSD